MHFHDAVRSQTPSLSLVVASVIAHALVPLPSHLPVAHVVASAHAAPHLPQFDASSKTHAPAQQKYVPFVGQSAGVVQLDPHATVENVTHANATTAPAIAIFFRAPGSRTAPRASRGCLGRRTTGTRSA